MILAPTFKYVASSLTLLHSYNSKYEKDVLTKDKYSI